MIMEEKCELFHALLEMCKGTNYLNFRENQTLIPCFENSELCVLFLIKMIRLTYLQLIHCKIVKKHVLDSGFQPKVMDLQVTASRLK